MNREAASDVLPKYWEMISQEDQEKYMALRKALSNPACRNRRNKSLETFRGIIESIKEYVIRGDEGDRNRSLVCGICWLRNGIGINTRQLRLILSKSKSSINGSFQAMGYGTISCGAETAGDLIAVFPFLRKDFSELRQWTVRQLMDKDVQIKAVINCHPPIKEDTQPKNLPEIAIQKKSLTPTPTITSSYMEPLDDFREDEFGYPFSEYQSRFDSDSMFPFI